MIFSITDKVKTFFTDFLTINLAWVLYYWFRVHSGWIEYGMEPDFWMPLLFVCLFWFVVYFFFGLYRLWYTKSRLDEFVTILKATTFGVLVLFFAIFIDDRGIGSPFHSRMLIVMYWALIVFCVGGGRLLQHTIHRRMLEAGIGLRNTLVVGWTEKAREVGAMVEKFPALGYNVVGYISTGKESPSPNERNVLGSLSDVEDIIDNHNVKDIIIALDSSEHDQLLNVIAACNSHEVSLKIIPDLYDIISGQARTNQIYGFPLVEIMPELMEPWERVVKRLMDIGISFVILLLGLPLWLLIGLVVKLDSQGNIFYFQERVGKDGKVFRMVKFRSMHDDAEKHSGPVWADHRDPRVTRIGKILRRLRLDEIPQLFNVLDGDMSLVGPRPEEERVVALYQDYHRKRLAVKPGMTGPMQVNGRGDLTLTERLRLELDYIEHYSLRRDIDILLRTLPSIWHGNGAH